MKQKNEPKKPIVKAEDIVVEVINKPTEQEADKKIAELSDFLSRTWYEKLETE